MIIFQNNKPFSIFILFLSITLSCNYEKNPCYDITCESNQICVNGSCINIKNDSDQFNLVNTPKPDRIILTSFFITRIPQTRSNGSPWDTGSNPDVYIQVIQDATIIFSTPTSINNLATIPYQVALDSPITITSIEETIAVNFYEDDGNLRDEFMGGATFIPFREDFPDSLKADLGGTVAAKFSAIYEFD